MAPTLSIGSVLLQQAAIQASFHYRNLEIVESRPDPSVSNAPLPSSRESPPSVSEALAFSHLQDLPSPDAKQIARNLSDLGQIYNREDLSTDNPVSALTLLTGGRRRL